MKHPGKLGALLIAALLGSATAALAQSINVQKINPQGVNHGANQLPQGKLQVKPPPRPNHGVNHEHLRSELHKQNAEHQRRMAEEKQQKELRAGAKQKAKEPIKPLGHRLGGEYDCKKDPNPC